MKETTILFIFLILTNSAWAKVFKIDISNQGHPPARLELPEKFYAKNDWPLVISLHGYRSSIFKQRFFARLEKHINELGFALLTPTTLKNSLGHTFWNASNYCCDFENSQVDDHLYIKRLIDHLTSDPKFARIDKNKVYLFGHSGGGFMAYSLACKYPDYFSAVATYAGAMDLRDNQGKLLSSDLPACEHSSSMPVFHIHGTDDQTIKVQGHDNVPETQTGYLSVERLMDSWKRQNKCSDPPALSIIDASYFINGQETTLHHFKNCNNGSQIVYAQVNGGEHISFLKASFYQKMIKFFFQFKK